MTPQQATSIRANCIARATVDYAPACLECDQTARIAGGDQIYPHRRDLYAKSFWLCPCGAYCGCHPNTFRPLGNPCGPETRRARNAAHAAFDPLWKRGEMSRTQAYKWLAEAIGIKPDKCHVGMMTADQAWSVVRAVKGLTS